MQESGFYPSTCRHSSPIRPNGSPSRAAEWLKAVCEHNEACALLLDRQMNVRLAYPEDKTWFGPIAPVFGQEALESGAVGDVDIHPSSSPGEIQLEPGDSAGHRG